MIERARDRRETITQWV